MVAPTRGAGTVRPLDRPPAGFRGRYLTDVPSRSAYSEGAGPYRVVPAAVAIPSDRDDVVRLVRHARDTGTTLVPRGAGSGMPGGNVGRGIVVDLAALDEPLAVSGTGGATVGAAVTWSALDEAAEPLGLRLPPDPSSGRFCTLGGMVATNAAGARTVRFGSVRPWVQAVELITADGEATRLERATDPAEPTAMHQRFDRDVRTALHQAAPLVRQRFPATRKNSAGYAIDAYLGSGDLLDLAIGSEGTLGIITRAEFRLAPRPGAVAGLLAGLATLDGLGDVLQHLLMLEPAALELLDSSFLRIAAQRSPLPVGDLAGVLLVDFEGADADAAGAAARQAAADLADQCPLVQSALTPDEHGRLWELRHAASPVLATLPDTRRSLQVIEDGCVPPARLSQYLTEVRGAAQDLGIEIVAFGHAGDGHLHVNALVDTTRTGFENRLQQLFDRVTDSVVRLGGTPSGEHGDGRLRAGTLERVYGAEVVDLFRAIKRAFDPHGIFNPGVIMPDPAVPALADLKAGPGAEDIPEHVARGLREIERSGGWALPKLQLLPESDRR